MSIDAAAGTSGDYPVSRTVGVFGGPWDTGWSSRDGAVLGFEDVFRSFRAAADTGAFALRTTDVSLFRDYRRIRDYLAACDVVYANCGPWAALLYLVREREDLAVRIIREVRTVGWIGYIWQEEVALQLERPGDQRVFPSRYCRDTWVDTAPSVADSRLFYPMIGGESRREQPGANTGGTAGFFSALSRDKGFDCLPGLIARLRAGGHAIDRVLLAGQQADPALYDRVVAALSGMGVAVDFRGGLSNGAVRGLMAGCDLVLFPSVSSLESLGRVILESCEQGVPVITADFGAARDLVHEDYRIPVDYSTDAAGPCDSAFPVARLALERWQPPARLSPQDCFLEAVDRYTVNAQTAGDILRPTTAELPARSWPTAFSFHLNADGLTLARELVDNSAALQAAPVHDLIDLGGALKRFLLTRGYNPRVRFQPAGAGAVEPATARNAATG